MFVYSEPEQHVSFYPKYFPRKLRDRNLAIYDGTHIITLDGEVFTPETFEEYNFISRREHLDIYVRDPAAFKWLDQCLVHKEDINASRTRGVVSINHRFHKGSYENHDGEKPNNRTQGKTAGTISWGYDGIPSSMFLNALHSFFDDYGHGIHPSPGSLGNAALVDKIKAEGGLRFSRPSVMLRSALQQHPYGGRADEPVDNKRSYELLIEDDINSCYPSCSMFVPNPKETPHLVFKPTPDELLNHFTWFAHIFITIPRGRPILSRGPMPYRKSKDDAISYPTMPGTYENWLFREEIDKCIEAGYSVEYDFAWVWKTGSNFMESWAKEIYALILKYKEVPDGETIEEREIRELKLTFAKSVSVALPGRMVMKPEKIVIVHVNEYEDGDIPLFNQDSRDDPTSDWFMRPIPDIDANHLTHIGEYIIMKGRVMLWERMLEYMKRGQEVITTNFDAVYTESGGLPTQPKTLGGWKSRKLYGKKNEPTTPNRRTLNTIQKVRRPGVKKTG